MSLKVIQKIKSEFKYMDNGENRPTTNAIQCEGSHFRLPQYLLKHVKWETCNISLWNYIYVVLIFMKIHMAQQLFIKSFHVKFYQITNKIFRLKHIDRQMTDTISIYALIYAHCVKNVCSNKWYSQITITTSKYINIRNKLFPVHLQYVCLSDSCSVNVILLQYLVYRFS
jgi:hypothetical protein